MEAHVVGDVSEDARYETQQLDVVEDRAGHEADLLQARAVEERERPQHTEVDGEQGAADGEGDGGLDLHERREVAHCHHDQEELVACARQAGPQQSARSASGQRQLQGLSLAGCPSESTAGSCEQGERRATHLRRVVDRRPASRAWWAAGSARSRPP